MVAIGVSTVKVFILYAMNVSFVAILLVSLDFFVIIFSYIFMYIFCTFIPKIQIGANKVCMYVFSSRKPILLSGLLLRRALVARVPVVACLAEVVRVRQRKPWRRPWIQVTAHCLRAENSLLVNQWNFQARLIQRPFVLLCETLLRA